MSQKDQQTFSLTDREKVKREETVTSIRNERGEITIIFTEIKKLKGHTMNKCIPTNCIT